ncbi:MAG: carbonic anhydrase [Kiloniellales bacterium]
MRRLTHLIEGYQRFRRGDYAERQALYQQLFEQGQAPDTMIVACCDSRADPTSIFAARPGELFVVRNVANLVPPCELDGHYHGTSAALEFAVTGLGVRNIVVLGHARCGGIRAFLDHREGTQEAPAFIAKWLSIVAGAEQRLAAATSEWDRAARQQALEQASILNSLDNLLSFPFIAERVDDGRLALHGAYFSIGSGRLLVYEPDRGAFVAVPDGGE